MNMQKAGKQTEGKGRFRLVLLIGVICVGFAVFGELSQMEVDCIVENEILMCEHDEDAEAIETDLRRRGVTEDMLGQGYLAALCRAKDAEQGSLDSEKFHSAAFGFAKVASQDALTNLLIIATCSTNDLNSADAILAYQERDPSASALLQWCVKEAVRTRRHDRVNAAIWECLGKGVRRPELAKEIKTNILDVARKAVLEEPMSAYEADRILSEHDPLYRKSLLRKLVVSRMESVKGEGIPDAVRLYFEKVKTEVEK